MMEHWDVIVIGGVAAGMSAARQIRRINKNMKVCVVERLPYISYGSCGIPYYIGGLVKSYKDLIALSIEDAKKKRGIEVYTEWEAKEVDFNRKIVRIAKVKDGNEKLMQYNYLVITTGAYSLLPNSIELPEDKIGIFTIRHIVDAIKLKNYIDTKNPKNAIIIGAGYIGMEMGDNLSRIGVDVEIVEAMQQILPNMNSDFADKVKKRAENKGVRFHIGKSVIKIRKDNSEYVATLSDGGEISAELVIFAVGVKPNVELFYSSGIKFGQNGAIEVDEHSRTNIEDVFSAGDCADVYNVIEDRKVYMPLGTTANKQGRVAGIYIAGYKQEKFSGIVGTQIAKAFGFEFARVGIDERIAKEISMNIDVISTKYHTKSSYMINNKNAYVKLYVDKKNGVIVGGQIVGEEGTARRIDILASAIFSHMSIKDFAYLDISYAPLFSPVWDPLLVSAQKSIKRGQR
jgi:NADPH-dependent 2,4-dienoyl-CoA reductase/sulfur reductase-like enzyme